MAGKTLFFRVLTVVRALFGAQQLRLLCDWSGVLRRHWGPPGRSLVPRAARMAWRPPTFLFPTPSFICCYGISHTGLMDHMWRDAAVLGVLLAAVARSHLQVLRPVEGLHWPRPTSRLLPDRPAGSHHYSYISAHF
jgi:hypothetical protein